MIKRVSDLLQKIIQAEAVRLQNYQLKHSPTIGDMYEGLTKDMLEKVLPIPLDVCAGFIVDEKGNLSDELDCMIVSAEGEEVPHTDKRKCKVDDVVAVLQVKKNLYASDIKDGYQNLLSVLRFSPSRMKNTTLFKVAYQSITRRPLPRRDDVQNLPFEIQMIYHSLLLGFATPARIILGYDGFKSHSNFRQSFVDYLAAQAGPVPIKGFNPTGFPDLIICGEWSLVKCNGMPFVAPVEKDLFWPFYKSSASNPIELLLQLVWTRLVFDEKLDPAVFDDDVWLQPFANFLSTKCIKKDTGEVGWGYKFSSASEEELENKEPPQRWSPSFLDLPQFIVISRLCKEEIVDLSDPHLAGFLAQNKYTVDQLVESLQEAGLAGRYDNHLELLTRECACAVLPDGRYAAGENIAGQLTQWLIEYAEERK